MMFSLMPSVSYASDAQAVTADKNGVLNLVLYYVADDGTHYALQTGSGFLINEEYLITCYHVVNLRDDVVPIVSEFFGADFRDHLAIRAIVMRDLEIDLTIENQSEATDFSILRLEQAISDRNALMLGDSETVEQTKIVYALGFPSVVTEVGATTSTSFTTADVTIENGAVSKILTGSDGVDYIQHSAKLTPGNSGGPLVDENGIVIGINKAIVASNEFFSSGYCYALAINQVKLALDALGIPYQNGVEINRAQLEALIAESILFAGSLSDYTEESASRFTGALSAAQSILGNADASQEDIDSSINSLTEARQGLVEKPILPLALVVGIAIAVIAILLAILIVVKMKSSAKKKRVPLPAIALPTDPAPSLSPSMASIAREPQYIPVNISDSAAPASASLYTPLAHTSSSTVVPTAVPTAVPTPVPTGYDAVGSGETTVLSPVAGETSLLSGPRPAAFLRRVSDGTKTRIDGEEFIIGKERSRVNYAIPNNGTISRLHAKITQRDGQFFITDLRSTNCTFVNERKITPGVETPLSNGDRIKLADEEFVFERS
ncbi:MAG: trypsin-like peptidase domain-containing protein [Coriobacteriales bacterium]|jgi:S1-C subfamily serine protease|nr:trypsin-like peptidase domain-containing protein [Coriobacteriales bacterium]